MKTWLLPLVVIALAVAACTDEKEDRQAQAEPTSLLVGTAKGCSGEPLAGAEVTLGADSALANEGGAFVIARPELPGVLGVAVGGYQPVATLVAAEEAGARSLEVRLLPIDNEAVLVASTGGSVMFGGAEVSLAAGALGASGTVTARLSLRQGSALADAVTCLPASLETAAGPIAAVGAIVFDVVDVSGASVAFSAASVRIPVPAGTPDASTLFALEAASGLFVEEGTLSGCASGLCEGTTAHGGWLVVGAPVVATCLRACVEDVAGGAAVDATLLAAGISGAGFIPQTFARLRSGSDGCACVPGEVGTQVFLLAASGSSSDDRLVAGGTAAASCSPDPSGCSPVADALTVAAPVALVALSWGDQPRDLDLRLSGPCPEGEPSCAGTFDVDATAPGTLSSAPWASLEADDADRYGPEVVTLARTHAATYRVTVLNRSGSPDLIDSQARILIWVRGVGATELVVPASNPTAAPVWLVADIRCAADGACSVTPLGQFGADDPGSYHPGTTTF